MDAATLAQAAVASRKRFSNRSPFGRAAVRVWHGRMQTINLASATTFQVTAELQDDFDWVQLIFANTNENLSFQAAQAAVTVLSDITADPSAATWTTVTQATQARITTKVAPGNSGRVGYTLSDRIPIASVARTDGGSKPIIVARAYVGASTVLPVNGDPADDFTNWATRTDGRKWIMREQAVNGVNTPTAFASTTNQSRTFIAGIRYGTRKRVVNVWAFGDSITDGRGTYLGEGFGLPAVEALNSSRLLFEYSNAGWSSQGQVFYARALDLLETTPELRPDVLVLPSGSPNVSLDAPSFAQFALWRSQVIQRCRELGVIPVVWTMIPCDPVVHDWNASDALRRADNALVLADTTLLTADFSGVVSGAIDSDGQTDLLDTYTTDHIHLNDAGNAAVAAVLVPVIRKAVGL